MKVKLTSSLLLISTCIFGQGIFPGNDTSLISGQQLKVNPLDKMFQKYGYEGFYKDEKLKKIYECCDGINSKYASLSYKTFKVINITPYTDLIGKEKFKIKLTNSETGEVYYDYDPNFEHRWHFQFAGDFSLPADFYCRNVEMKADKFTGDTTFSTPSASGFSFIKVKKGITSTIYLNKNEPGSTLNVGKKGVILLLENNKRIDKSDAELDVKASKYGSSYIYTAFFELTSTDIKLLSENAITDCRLYIYDGAVKNDNGKKIIEYLKCLLNK